MAPLVFPGCQQVLFACDTLNCLCTARAPRKLLSPASYCKVQMLLSASALLLAGKTSATAFHITKSLNRPYLEVDFQQMSPKLSLLASSYCSSAKCLCYCLIYSLEFDLSIPL